MNQTIKNIISDMVTDLLYYDRKEDDEVKVGDIEAAIKRGDFTVVIGPHFQISSMVAPMGGGHVIFAARFHPLHRPFDQLG